MFSPCKLFKMHQPVNQLDRRACRIPQKLHNLDNLQHRSNQFQVHPLANLQAPRVT
jgi:hypothetical protein